MGILFSVLAVVGAAALVLPRVWRRSSAEDAPAPKSGGTVRTDSKAAPAHTGSADSPSRRFLAAGQRVGSGGLVAPEPLREAKGSAGWQPEMDGGFHQTTAYPEPPVAYESAEEQTRSGSRPISKPAPQPGAGDSARSS